jgi:hypothetical protein
MNTSQGKIGTRPRDYTRELVRKFLGHPSHLVDLELGGGDIVCLLREPIAA